MALVEHTDSSPYFNEETTAELIRLAKKFHGGWYYSQGIMPMISITLKEAQELERRLIPDPQQPPSGCGEQSTTTEGTHGHINGEGSGEGS